MTEQELRESSNAELIKDCEEIFLRIGYDTAHESNHPDFSDKKDAALLRKELLRRLEFYKGKKA